MKGRIILTTGPMFSGKSSWIIEELKRENPEEIIAVRYFLDDRYNTDSITTHDGKKLKAITARSEKDILDHLKKNPKVKTLGVDELQFFDSSISDFFKDLRNKNLTVITAGLNVDHNNEEWETTKKVKSTADSVNTLLSVCAVCGKKNATISNRKGRRDARVVIGGAELYEALCEKDYLEKFSL